MKALNLIDSIIHITWLGVFVLVLLLGITMFSSFTNINEKEVEVICAPIKEMTAEETQAYDKLVVGKTLFKKNCASCHHKNMKDDLTGPALHGVKKRWSEFPNKDLYSWIRNSAKLVDEKHPRALEIWEKWNKSPMTSFVDLSDDEIEAILAYIDR